MLWQKPSVVMMGLLMNQLALPSLPQRLIGRQTFANSEQSAFLALSLVVAAAITIVRITHSFGVPLWLDETWTAVIATQPNWSLFWREAWLDCNAPLYYIIERVWISLAGVSNVAMRLPSAICLYLAALVPLLWRISGLNKQATITWSLMLLLWWPGLMISIDARAYGLLLLLSVCNLIAFTKLHLNLNTRTLAVWSTLSSLLVLTHYYGYFLLLSQGILLAWKYRLGLVRYCHGLLPFTPALAWTLYHLPRLAAYARPDVVWYEPTTFETTPRYLLYTFGAPSPYFAPSIAAALGIAFWRSGWRLSPQADKSEFDRSAHRAINAAMLSGVIALALVLIISGFQASLAERYLVPIVPFMLLAVVCSANRLARKDLAYILLIVVYATYALVPGPLHDALQSRSFYGYEAQSRYVAASKPSNVLFVWDHPATKIMDDRSLEQIGTFFLRRDGIQTTTNVLKLQEDKDPNVEILQAARNPRTAVIWLYDAKRRSAAANFPPTLSTKKDWQCSDQRKYVKYDRDNPNPELEVGVIACRPRLQSGAS